MVAGWKPLRHSLCGVRSMPELCGGRPESSPTEVYIVVGRRYRARHERWWNHREIECQQGALASHQHQQGYLRVFQSKSLLRGGRLTRIGLLQERL